MGSELLHVLLYIHAHFQLQIISATNQPITIKVYMEHHWGGGFPAIGFEAGWLRTLVSMATDSPHRVIIGKTFLQL